MASAVGHVASKTKDAPRVGKTLRLGWAHEGPCPMRVAGESTGPTCEQPVGRHAGVGNNFYLYGRHRCH